VLLAVGLAAQEGTVADTSDRSVPVIDSGATAAVLRLIRFSGTVPGAQGPAGAGPVGATFALYAEQEEGSPLWLESQNVELDQQGRYTALLGATQSEGLPLELFTSGEARWLGIQVQGRPEQPRILLVSVPYALRAEEAQRLAGREVSEFLLAEQLESNVQQVVETKVVEELEAQGLVSTEEGVTPAITDGASTFTDNNATQVVLVTQNGTGKGLKAVSTTGNAIDAESTGTSGTNFTLLGINRSTGGRALFGFASATTGNTIAAAGRADSTAGIGFFGQALATSGQTVGVQSEVRSPSGIAGVFANTAGGPLLEGRSQGQLVFSVDGSGSINGGFRVEADATGPNVIGGFSGNAVTAGVVGATIGGGGSGTGTNRVTDDLGTVGGGKGNRAGDNAGTTSDTIEATVGGGSGNIASGDRATVGGGFSNDATGDNATVGGGSGNTASGTTATVAGGANNTASGNGGTVAGGVQNSASGSFRATVAGGVNNIASADFATVGGGDGNTASSQDGTVGGGRSNTASGLFATVPGGESNTALGTRSFAAGNRAKANANGSFVWGDNTAADVTSSTQNEFLIRASGGLRMVVGATPTEVFSIDGSGDVTATSFSGDGSGLTGLPSDTHALAGTGNTGVGVDALANNTTGADNTGLGVNALSANVSANNNTAVGRDALLANTAADNTAVGAFALDANTSGFNNTALGASALSSNTTGTSNTALGVGALFFTTASMNTAVGAFALDANTTGFNNTALGSNALGANQTGEDNTAVGRDALLVNTVGDNTAVGAFALDANTTGDNNTAVGSGTLGANQTSDNNTAVGQSALVLSTGSSNIALGTNAGSNLTSGNSNIYIGNDGVSSESTTIRIGAGGTHTDTFIAGVRGVTTDNADAITVLIDSAGQLGTVSSSRRTKEDIREMGEASAALQRLRPVVFRYRKPFANGSKPLQYGLIAEEVAEVYPELVAFDAEGEPETVLYRFLAPLLLTEVQRQQDQIQKQQALLQELRAELAVVKVQLDRADRMTLAEVQPQD
jgi:hypothetical protein